MKIKLVRSFTKKPMSSLKPAKYIDTKYDKNNKIKAITHYYGSKKHGYSYYLTKSGTVIQTHFIEGRKTMMITYVGHASYIQITTINDKKEKDHYMMEPPPYEDPCYDQSCNHKNQHTMQKYDVCEHIEIKPSASARVNEEFRSMIEAFSREFNKHSQKKYSWVCTHEKKVMMKIEWLTLLEDKMFRE